MFNIGDKVIFYYDIKKAHKKGIISKIYAKKTENNMMRITYDILDYFDPNTIYSGVPEIHISACTESLENIYITQERGHNKSWLDNYIGYNINPTARIIHLTKEEQKRLIDGGKLPLIEHIYYNVEKGTTVVIFYDGTKIIKKLCDNDKFDLKTAVALAIAEKKFGSKNKFYKHVDAYNKHFESAINIYELRNVIALTEAERNYDLDAIIKEKAVDQTPSKESLPKEEEKNNG